MTRSSRRSSPGGTTPGFSILTSENLSWKARNRKNIFKFSERVIEPRDDGWPEYEEAFTLVQA